MHRLTAVVFAIVTFASCAFAQTTPRLSPDVQALWNAYENAVVDSSVYQQWNVRPLRPLTPDSGGQVLIVTLTSYYDGKIGDEITSSRDGIWVTGVPEVQTKCRAFKDVNLELAELLGLPPDSVYARFLVLRANAADLFRPSPDPSTNTTYPCATSGSTIPPDCGNAFPSSTTPTHFQWMATAAFSLHKVGGGYPWTHLGYTYDWAPGADRYGASEYVLRSGAKAVIVAKATPAEYCK